MAASSLIDHLLYCNFYAKGSKHVEQVIFNFYIKFKYLLMHFKQKFYQKSDESFFDGANCDYVKLLIFYIKITAKEKLFKKFYKIKLEKNRNRISKR